MSTNFEPYGRENKAQSRLAGVEMVPGKLRGYRQFLFDLDDYNEGFPPLASPSYSRCKWKLGGPSPTAKCAVVKVQAASASECDACARQLEDSMLWRSIPSPSGEVIVQRIDTICPHSSNMISLVYHASAHAEPVPEKSCSCGFYATHELLPLSHATGISWHDAYHTRYRIPLIAAVSATGRIILGDVGFRAEKMQIDALAWPRAWHKDAGLSKAKTAVKAMCESVGIPFFKSAARMVSHFPPDDVSSIVTTRKSEAVMVIQGFEDWLRENGWISRHA